VLRGAKHLRSRRAPIAPLLPILKVGCWTEEQGPSAAPGSDPRKSQVLEVYCSGKKHLENHSGRASEIAPLPAGTLRLLARALVPRKLHLKALLGLRNSIERGERNLKLLRASAANCDNRHSTQPLRYLKGSFLRFHSPTALGGTSFRDANALNRELCSCRADLSAERIGFTSPFSAFVALNKSSRIRSSSRRVKTIPDASTST